MRDCTGVGNVGADITGLEAVQRKYDGLVKEVWAAFWWMAARKFI